MLPPVHILSKVLRSVRPSLKSLAVLSVPYPITHILRPVGVQVLSKPLRLVIAPFSLVNIAVSVRKFPGSASFVIDSVALILASVLPSLDAESVSLVVFPLPLVDHSAL